MQSTVLYFLISFDFINKFLFYSGANLVYPYIHISTEFSILPAILKVIDNHLQFTATSTLIYIEIGGNRLS